MTVIVSHSYISAKWHLNKGKASTWQSAKVAAVNKTVGHIDYIQHRPGVDREKHGREFFDEKDDQVDGKDVREMAREEGKNRNIVAHKLMISPDIQVPDLKKFTREVMQELSNEKGLDLNWKAVEHRNTEHPHVHILIMAKDRNGREVRLTKQDHDKVEKTADRILDRDYPWHRRELRFERQEREREIHQREAEQELENFRFSKLPWMKQRVIREQYQPYADWKKDVDRKRQERMEFEEKPITIADKEYTQESALEELQGAKKILHRRSNQKLPRSDYKKLRKWIASKEYEADSGRKADPDPDKFEFQGRSFTKDTPVEELKALNKFLYELKDEPGAKKDWSLHPEDKAKLNGWIKEKQREQGFGSAEAALKDALTRQAAEERQYADSAAILQEQDAAGTNLSSQFTGLDAPDDDREKASKRMKAELTRREKTIDNALEKTELAESTQLGTNPERNDSIKRLKLAGRNIGRFLNSQDERDLKRRREIQRQQQERDFDDADFPGEF